MERALNESGNAKGIHIQKAQCFTMQRGHVLRWETSEKASLCLPQTLLSFSS